MNGQRLRWIAIIVTLVGVLVVSTGLVSAKNKERAKSFLRSAINIDLAARTVTLPLHEGVAPDGSVTYYIITEASDRKLARKLGVNWSPLLENATGTVAAQNGRYEDGKLTFEGTVNFSPARIVVPNPDTGFPPTSFQPGSVGNAKYTPLVVLPHGDVLNAPQVANTSGLHDRIHAIDYRKGTVTLALVDGFYEGDPFVYISTEASIELAAALEQSTYAPNLQAAPGIGTTDDPSSARQPILLVVNGETGATNPERQGLESALQGDGAPLNTFQEEPGSDTYSPIWDAYLAIWTDTAIERGQRTQIRDIDDVADLVQDGLITSGGNGPANAELGGLRAANFVINCPIMAELR